MATSEHLEHLERANISRVAPFVNKITFVAPPNSWTLTYDGFKEVLVAQAIQRYASDHQIWNGSGSYAYENDGHRIFIEQQWGGRFALLDTQIRDGFERYHKDALAAKDLLQGKDLKIAWTKALRALPKDLKLRFVTVEYDESDCSHLPVLPDCTVRPHHHDENHQEETCRRVTAPLGDALFAAAIACLAEADVKARKLDVECAMMDHFQWEALPGWGACDFSQVQSFKFQPHVRSIKEDLDSPGGEDMVARQAAYATAAVLKKCNDSLEKFHYQDSCPMQWPGDEVIPLPKLKKLSFGGGCIRPRNLKAWMAQMPLLEHFECMCTSSCGSEDGSWLEVFDAIRNHPRGMKVDFDQIFAGEEEISMRYHTDDFQELLVDEAQEEPWSDVSESLRLYLSGKIDMDEATKESLRY